MVKDRILSAWPIRRKLLLLLLLIFLPAFAIIFASGLKQRKEEIDKARNSALLLAQSLTAQQQQIATSTKVLLTTLAQSPALQHTDAKACNQLFEELNQRFPLYSAILAAATPNGNMFAASKPFKPGTVNLADRKHFKDAISTLDFSVGEYMTGRVSTMQSLNYTFPVLNSRRKLIAIVIAGFSLDEYERFVKQVSMPAGYSVAIADWKGARLFRAPADSKSPPANRLPATRWWLCRTAEIRAFLSASAPMGWTASTPTPSCVSTRCPRPTCTSLSAFPNERLRNVRTRRC